MTHSRSWISAYLAPLGDRVERRISKWDILWSQRNALLKSVTWEYPCFPHHPRLLNQNKQDAFGIRPQCWVWFSSVLIRFYYFIHWILNVWRLSGALSSLVGLSWLTVHLMWSLVVFRETPANVPLVPAFEERCFHANLIWIASETNSL